MSGKLDGRVAVITGAAQGIGFAIAERFKAEGAKLLMADLDETKVNAAADRLASKSYARPLVHAGDLADETVAQDMIRTAVGGYGTLDILINNAGGGIIQPFVDHTPESLRTTVDRNLWTTVWSIFYALPEKRRKKYRPVVSLGADSIRHPLWDHARYQAGKRCVHR